VPAVPVAEIPVAEPEQSTPWCAKPVHPKDHGETEAQVPPDTRGPEPAGSSSGEAGYGSTDQPALVSSQASEEMQTPPVRREKSRQLGDLSSVLQSLAITVVIAVFVITFVVQAFQIPSESMEDTLLVGDYLLVDKIHFGHGGIWGEVLPYMKIKRGDIVVFHYPIRPEQHFVKRVIGLPGDRIRMKERVVWINGKPLQENYVVYRSPAHDSNRGDFPRLDFLSANMEASWWSQMRSLVHNGELTVPVGHYFVLGDNRDQSLDSRYWGFVPQENIVGRPLVVYWSVRHSQRLGRVAEKRDDKLLSFAYAVTHWLQDTRWNRTFRLIR
jgi:signal peptidase I